MKLPPDSVNTWDKLIDIAKYNNKSIFKLSSYSRNNLVRIDSTVFGKKIQETYHLKSSYIIAVKPKFGDFYPCVVYGQQYDCDDITNYIALFMIDSLLEKKGDFEIISGSWSDWEGSCNYFSELSDSIMTTSSSYSFECGEEMGREDGLNSFNTKEQFLINKNGEIISIQKDTLNKKYCRQQ